MATTRTLLAATALSLAWTATATGQDYPHASESIGTVEQIYDGHLMPDLAVSTFRNIDRLFPVRTIEAGDTPRALPQRSRILRPWCPSTSTALLMIFTTSRP